MQIAKVYPGPYGGAIIVGVPVGQREELRSKVNSRLITRMPRQGEFWSISGSMVEDRDYGLQLVAQVCRPSDLPYTSYVSSLLANHPAFKGFALGRKKVGDVVKSFGDEALVKHLDDGNIHKLTEVLTYPVARGLVDAWKFFRSEIAILKFLIDHRFSPELARKVMYLCREGTAERIKTNPYVLVCFGGITGNIWGTMERCARNLGFSLDFEGRLVGAVEHVLYERLRSGHTASGLEVLLAGAERLLGTRKRAEEGLRLALEQKAVCVYSLQTERLFQLVGVGIIEQTFERRIDSLVSGSRQIDLFYSDERRVKHLVDDYDQKLRTTVGLALNAEQKAAVLMALTNRCSVITGYDGTGKTTVLKAAADVARLLGRQTYMLGKAKERLRQATGHKSFTIHAFIGAVRKGAEDVRLDDDPLIVIDDCSMVDVVLFNNLLGLFGDRQFSLLTVGDLAQISPVGFGLVWHRMAMLEGIPRTNLTQVYRQRSSLHDMAMMVCSNDVRVLSGIADAIPVWNGETEGVYFAPANRKNLRETLFKLKRAVDENIRRHFRTRFAVKLQGVALEARMRGAENGGEIPKAVILTPHMSRRMSDSGDKINRHLQGCLTPLADSLLLGEHRLRVGDPVIVTENSYDLGLFNGTTGILLRISTRYGQASGCFRLDGHKEPVWLTTDKLLDVGMRVAYAVSIYKAPGSKYDAVLVTCVEKSPMLEKSFVYTVLTRSKNLCLIVGSREVFSNAVQSPRRTETLEVGFFLSRMARFSKTI